MSGLADKVLSRFPAHFDALAPGKRLRDVAEAIAGELAALQTEVASVRRSHRLAHAPTVIDIDRIAALHGLTPVDFRLLVHRIAATIGRAAGLAAALAAASVPQRDAAADALLALWDVALPTPRFAALVAALGDSGPADPDQIARALLQTARASVGHAAELAARRRRVAVTAQVHAEGNGTVRALLLAGASLLDLEIDHARNAAVKAALVATGVADGLDLSVQDELFHSADRFWHASFVRDLLPPAAWVANAIDAPDDDEREVIALEENPRRLAESAIGPVRHGQYFVVTRRGFAPQLLRIAIAGIGTRTVGPHLVNRDQGAGVGYAGSVADGAELIIGEDGRARLAGADVTDRLFSWRGACFADAAAPHRRDFVFAGAGVDATRQARFAVATPENALDRDATPPFGSGPVAVPSVGLGVTRFAFFCQVAHLSARDPGATLPRRVAPRTKIGVADGAVFAATPSAPGDPAADLTLSWLEYTPYAVRLHLPPRFAALDDDGFDTRSTVAQQLDRFRAAGVHVEVVYQDESWTLGAGELPGAGATDPIRRLRAGTSISPAPADAGGGG